MKKKTNIKEKAGITRCSVSLQYGMRMGGWFLINVFSSSGADTGFFQGRGKGRCKTQRMARIIFFSPHPRPLQNMLG